MLFELNIFTYRKSPLINPVVLTNFWSSFSKPAYLLELLKMNSNIGWNDLFNYAISNSSRWAVFELKAPEVCHYPWVYKRTFTLSSFLCQYFRINKVFLDEKWFFLIIFHYKTGLIKKSVYGPGLINRKSYFKENIKNCFL